MGKVAAIMAEDSPALVEILRAILGFPSLHFFWSLVSGLLGKCIAFSN